MDALIYVMDMALVKTIIFYLDGSFDSLTRWGFLTLASLESVITHLLKLFFVDLLKGCRMRIWLVGIIEDLGLHHLSTGLSLYQLFGCSLSSQSFIPLHLLL